MEVASQLKGYLDKHQANYLLLPTHSLGIKSGDILVRAIIISLNSKLVMLVVPAEKELNIESLQLAFNQKLPKKTNKVNILSTIQAGSLFKDCSLGNIPALAAAYGMKLYLDSSIIGYKRLIFSAGSANFKLRMSWGEYKFLAGKYNKLVIPDISKNSDNIDKFNITNKNPKLANIISGHFISNPDINQASYNILIDSQVNTKLQQIFDEPEILGIIDVLNYSRGKRKTIIENIGLHNNKFHLEHTLLNLWKHSVLAANLVQEFAEHLNLDKLICSKVALFHNIGLIAFAYNFRIEYMILMRLLKTKPGCNITTLEPHIISKNMSAKCFTLGHAKVGAILCDYLDLPQIVIDAALNHHSNNHDMEKEIVLLKYVNYILAYNRMGDFNFKAKNFAIIKNKLQLSSEVLHLVTNKFNLLAPISLKSSSS